MIQIIPPLRGEDIWGSGAFGARRGYNKHRGIDIACYQGSQIISPVSGFITKIGFPYSQNDSSKSGRLKRRLRYIQVTDYDHCDARFFYVSANYEAGSEISRGDILGTSQGLEDVYKGITDHIHFEVKIHGEIINPQEYLKQCR